jgi:arylsulfatase A-like enzyme
MIRSALIALLAITAPLTAAQQPNIVFFFVDDMGWQDTSVPFHSETTRLNREYRTPNMEKLAGDGLVFTNAYACSVCSPSRVSLMTGQNAARHKVTCWTLRKDKSPEGGNKILVAPPWNLNGLQPKGAHVARSYEADCLPKLLHQAGYHTIHAGKGHFGAKDTPGADPAKLGFDVNIAGSYMGGPGSYHGDHNFSAAWRGGGHIWDIPGLEKYHGQKINLTEAITREVIAEVERTVAAKKPFYLYLSHYAVHAPFEPDRRFLPDYEDEKWNKHQKVYASMLASMDKSLGDIRATLDRLGVADNTIVVFMSDNGSPRNNPHNLPLRGHKISGYEGGSRVPMIVQWPGVTKAGGRTSAPVIIEDIFPTFLELAGVSKPPKVDGRSFTDILKTPATDRSRRPLFWHYPNLYDMPPYSAVRLGNHKLIYWHSNQKLELFNLKDDIGEKHDLAAEDPGTVKMLATLLAKHLRETKADMPILKKSGNVVPYPDDSSQAL